MALQPREKKLAAVVGVLGIGVFAWLGWQAYAGAVRLREGQIDAISGDVQKKQMLMARARFENDRLAAWEERSLPRNAVAAASLYQNWLAGTVDRAQLTQVNIEPGRATKVPGIYVKLPFALRARGTLAQTTAWLAAFYRADHLHQLRDLSLQPTPDGAALQITANIEALALDDATRTDALSTAASTRLDETRGAALAAAITTRNVFAPYTPPPPPPPPPKAVVEAPPAPPPPPAFDPSKFAFLTSIVFVEAQPQAWLYVRPTNQLLKLNVGDAVEVGTFRGKLVRIGEQEIEVDSDGKRRVVALGKSLEQAVELPAAAL